MGDSVLKTEPADRPFGSGRGGGALPRPAAGPQTLGWDSNPVQFQIILFPMLIIVVSPLHDG
jgi:hypothetical protein